jgi:hypothetical protein
MRSVNRPSFWISFTLRWSAPESMGTTELTWLERSFSHIHSEHKPTTSQHWTQQPCFRLSGNVFNNRKHVNDIQYLSEDPLLFRQKCGATKDTSERKALLTWSKICLDFEWEVHTPVRKLPESVYKMSLQVSPRKTHWNSIETIYIFSFCLVVYILSKNFKKMCPPTQF